MDSGSQHEDAEYAWHLLLESHRHPDGEPNATIEIAYEAGQVNLERYARSFQSVALLEALSDYVSSRYALPRPIKMVMASCGDAMRRGFRQPIPKPCATNWPTTSSIFTTATR